MGDDPYWTFRKNSVGLVELSRINKFSLVQVSFCSNTGTLITNYFCCLQEFFLLLMRDILDPKYGMFKTIEENHLIWFNKQVN